MPGSWEERKWRNAARNRDSWQKLLKKALGSKGGRRTNGDDDEYIYRAKSDCDMEEVL